MRSFNKGSDLQLYNPPGPFREWERVPLAWAPACGNFRRRKLPDLQIARHHVALREHCAAS